MEDTTEKPEQYLRGIRAYHKGKVRKETPPVLEGATTPEKQLLKEENDAFFRDQLTGTPERLHKSIGPRPTSKKETEPVILPPIPENWIVKIPQGLGGGEQHYRLSEPKNAEEAINKLGLGFVTSTDRGIIILDHVPPDEVPKLELKGDIVIPINEVSSKLAEAKTSAEQAKAKTYETEVPEGFLDLWEYLPTESSEYNLRQLPLVVPPLDEITRDKGKIPMLESYSPGGKKDYYTPITNKLMLARARQEFKNKVSDINPENVLLVTRTPENVVKDRLDHESDKFEKISVSKVVREYQQTKPKRAA